MRARIVALWQRSVCNLSNATLTVLLVNIGMSFRYPSSMSFATTVLEANNLSNGLRIQSPRRTTITRQVMIRRRRDGSVTQSTALKPEDVGRRLLPAEHAAGTRHSPRLRRSVWLAVGAIGRILRSPEIGNLVAL